MSDSTDMSDDLGDAHENCSETLHELYHFLDGELTDDKRAAIQVHLEECPPCFEAFDFEAEIKAYIASKCQEKSPDSLRARIAEAIGHEPPA